MAADLLTTIRNEIEQRLSELRPLLDEQQQLLHAAEALDSEQRRQRAAGAPRARKASSAPSAPRGAAREAILAALEHGSHTVGELAMVTATSRANVSANVRRMLADGAIVKTEREGKLAYALAA